MEADLLAGRYELGEVIGRGRSPVYAARDARLGREVAVKRVALAPGPDEVDDVRARAQREARAAARLASPHVVTVFDVVEEPDAVWLVMELVRAPSLEALVRERGPLPPALAARIGLGVLDALVAAHAVGVLHRDVKPANVLVSVGANDGGDDDSLGVKLTDFGVAALQDESGLTLPGLVVGSPSYMAPEQASGDEVGPPADLWALGALLYFAVEGVPPFARGSALATAAAVVHGSPRPHHHPGALTPLIDALLTKDPARRPDAAAVRATLRALAAAPAGPGPATTQITAAAGGSTQITAAVAGHGWRRLPTERRARPHRRRAALAAAAVAALLTGAAGLLLGVGGDPGPAGPPAADAQTTSLPAGAGPATTVAPVESGRRAATPSDVAVEPSEAPAQAVAADPGGGAASAGAASGPAPAAGPTTTTTTPDPSDPRPTRPTHRLPPRPPRRPPTPRSPRRPPPFRPGVDRHPPQGSAGGLSAPGRSLEQRRRCRSGPPPHRSSPGRRR